MDLATFNSQLQTMEQTLLGFYKQKATFISIREGTRFGYVTSMKSVWDSMVNEIVGQGFNSSNVNGVTLTQMVLAQIQSAIPMADVAGNTVNGWALMPGSPGVGGGVNGAGFLSPIANIITAPFNDPTNPDQRPAYQIYGAGQWNGSNATYLQYVFDNILSGWAGQVAFSIPPSTAWITGVFGGVTAYAAMAPSGQLDPSIFQYVNTVIGQTYPDGSLTAAYQAFKDTFSNIIAQTQQVINLQVQIDGAELALSTFVGQYSQYAGSVNAASILLNLQQQAAQANVPDPQTVVAASQAVTAPAGPSPLLWLAGAAVIGVALLGGHKK